MICPGKVLSACMRGNALHAACETGNLVLTPYGAQVLHVAYYPDTPFEETMWGICAQPDAAQPVRFTENECAYVISLGALQAEVNKADGAVRFMDQAGMTAVSLLSCGLEKAVVSGENTYHVYLCFSSDENEKFYGLGQHQDGKLDLGGREQVMWHDYSHKGGEIVAVPFLVSSKKYAVLLDNPSRSRVWPGINGKTTWQAEVGDRVSFFLILGDETDALYRGYRLLSGYTPMPPRRGLGFIQCKQRYTSQKELLDVARTYHEKQYPCDLFVVDWFHWKTLGDMQVDTAFWPDSRSMNRQLAQWGYETMISCWPRFMKESLHYAELEENGWFMKDVQGKTVYGTPDDQRGALIDTTNPACGAWYFDTVKKGYADQGYKYWWTDENEPDISPHQAYLHAGTGARVHNIYPLTHSRCMYEGHREALSHRCLILSRAAYTGAQRYGTTFWSSDIFPEWDVLKRQIPTALNFCASGMPYWSSDIGGWQPLPDEDSGEDYSSLLLATTSEGKGAVTKKNYTELYIRWFQFGVFCPTFRTHGTRKHNEIWSYGEEAERILEKFLKLRYRLMPYIYSLAYGTMRTGAPFMRAMWMDFEDPICQELEDQFMFGPALMIAPVTEQGATERNVYLPGGYQWMDFNTGERYAGGQTVEVHAPIDTLPIFVKSGSILPLGEDVLNLEKGQNQIQVLVCPGGDATFDMYSDDGQTYDYEKGCYRLDRLVWHDQTGEGTVENVHAWENQDEMHYTWKVL